MTTPVQARHRLLESVLVSQRHVRSSAQALVRALRIGRTETRAGESDGIPLPAVAAAALGFSAVVLGELRLTPLALVIILVAGLLSLRQPIAGLALLVSVASFVDFAGLTQDRLEVGGLPINLVDMAVLASLPALLGRLAVPSRARRYLYSRNATNVLMTLLFAALVLGALRGIVEGQTLYNMTRHARPILFVVLGLALTRLTVSRWAEWTLLFAIAIAGGAYALVVSLVQRLAFISALVGPVDYLDARNPVTTTATVDLAFIVPVAALVVGWGVRRRRNVFLVLALIGLVAYLFTLRLSAFVVAVLVPPLAVVLAEGARRNKLLFAARFTLAVIVLMGAVLALPGASDRTPGPQLLRQAAAKLVDPSAVSFRSRELAWAEAARRLDPLGVVIGVGLGYEDYVDGGQGIDRILVGEPTFATLLLTLGLLGSVALLALLLNLVLDARNQYQIASPWWAKTVLLSVSVVGCVTIAMGFLHNNLLAPQSSVMLGVLIGLVEWVRHQHSGGAPWQRPPTPL